MTISTILILKFDIDEIQLEHWIFFISFSYFFALDSAGICQYFQLNSLGMNKLLFPFSTEKHLFQITTYEPF